MTNGISAPNTESTIKNRRKAIRYTSRNRKAIITLKRLLWSNLYIHIKIINISSIGTRISSRYKLSTRSKIKLNIKTKNGVVWRIQAKVIRSYSNAEYGVIFETMQPNLIDQIIKYETDFSIV